MSIIKKSTAVLENYKFLNHVIRYHTHLLKLVYTIIFINISVYFNYDNI